MSMTHGDLILAIDKRQQGPDGMVCPREAEHGKLLALLDGTTLLCCKCGFRAAASLGEDDSKLAAGAARRKAGSTART